MRRHRATLPPGNPPAARLPRPGHAPPTPKTRPCTGGLGGVVRRLAAFAALRLARAGGGRERQAAHRPARSSRDYPRLPEIDCRWTREAGCSPHCPLGKISCVWTRSCSLSGSSPWFVCMCIALFFGIPSLHASGTFPWTGCRTCTASATPPAPPTARDRRRHRRRRWRCGRARAVRGFFFWNGRGWSCCVGGDATGGLRCVEHARRAVGLAAAAVPLHKLGRDALARRR